MKKAEGRDLELGLCMQVYTRGEISFPSHMHDHDQTAVFLTADRVDNGAGHSHTPAYVVVCLIILAFVAVVTCAFYKRCYNWCCKRCRRLQSCCTDV